MDLVFDRNTPRIDAANNMHRILRTQGPTNAPEWPSTLGEAIQANDGKMAPLQMADLFAARLKDRCSNGRNSSLIRALLEVSGKGATNITFHAKRRHIEALIGASDKSTLQRNS